MGLGGDLMWTALAQEIFILKKKSVCFIQNNSILKKDIWLYNPAISFNLKNSIIINLDFKLLPERINYKQFNISQHTIISRCKYFGILKPKIKCYMYFSNEEIKYIESIVKNLPKKFIIIEPHAKLSWCKHKQYPLDKWQNIVNSISGLGIKIVQMSLPNQKILDNVINVGDKIKNFRQACLLLKYCSLFISTEGGLMHGANAVNCESIIIFCPLFHPKFTKYDNIIDIWVHTKEHNNCFIEGECSKCIDIMNNHNENEIINKIKFFFRPLYSGSGNIDFLN